MGGDRTHVVGRGEPGGRVGLARATMLVYVQINWVGVLEGGYNSQQASQGSRRVQRKVQTRLSNVTVEYEQTLSETLTRYRAGRETGTRYRGSVDIWVLMEHQCKAAV